MESRAARRFIPRKHAAAKTMRDKFNGHGDIVAAAGCSGAHGLRDTLAQHAFEIGRIMGLEHRGFARQVEVPEP
jgi:hypothetical protein